MLAGLALLVLASLEYPIAFLRPGIATFLGITLVVLGLHLVNRRNSRENLQYRLRFRCN